MWGLIKCRGQESLNWNFFYIIGKLLECTCLKWVCMIHLDTLNTSYGQTKGRESNYQIDFRPLKVENRLDFLTCRWCVTYRWKVIEEGYNFAWNFISIKGLHAKLGVSKVARVRILGISGLSFESLGTKWHLGVGLVIRHRVYYKGEGDSFP